MKRQTYTPEIKERTVRILIEAKDDYPSTWSAIQAIAPKIGCTPKTLRSWHKKRIDKTIPVSVQAQSIEHFMKGRFMNATLTMLYAVAEEKYSTKTDMTGNIGVGSCRKIWSTWAENAASWP